MATAPGCGSRRASTVATTPDNMPQAITVTDAQGRWAVYVPLQVNGKIVVPDDRAHGKAAMTMMTRT
jgi:hypothetical protein